MTKILLFFYLPASWAHRRHVQAHNGTWPRFLSYSDTFGISEQKTVRLNPKKRVVLWEESKLVWGCTCTPRLTGTVNTPPTSVRNLGVLLDPELLLDHQVMFLAWGAFCLMLGVHLSPPPHLYSFCRSLKVEFLYGHLQMLCFSFLGVYCCSVLIKELVCRVYFR